MRHVTRPIIDTSPLEALRVSLRDWLVCTLVWLVETLEPACAWRHAPAWLRAALAAAERQLDAELRATAHDLRRMLVVHAYARMRIDPPPRLTRAPRPASVLRRAQNNSFLRKCTGPALKGLHAGSLRQRAQRLRDALDNFDALAADVRAHMTHMFVCARLPGVITNIVNDARDERAAARAPACADTS